MGEAVPGGVVSPQDEIFLSPGDLCERWRVDWKTLNKFELPWVRLSPTVRRIELSVVVQYERANRLGEYQATT